MPLTKAKFLLAACLTLTFSHAVLSQDSESLGDVARQARQQKQDKESQDNRDGGAAKAPKVITNEEISSGSTSVPENSGSVADTPKADEPHSSESAKQSAESWRSQILAQKQSIGSLEAEIAKLSDSIQFAPANCVSGCVQWNERQQQKQQEVGRMRSQLDTLNQHLQEMQEAARQQGYGSSIYDP